MSNFVNKIKKGETEYDIQDARIPTTTSEDFDKYLHVNAETGAFEFAEVQGGEDVPHIVLPNTISGTTTLAQIVALNIGIEMPNKYTSMVYYVEFTSNWYAGSSRGMGKAKLDIRNYNNVEIYITFEADSYYQGLYHSNYEATGVDTPLSQYTEKDKYLIRGIPDLPSDASSKTYVLQSDNGYIHWVEKEAAGE